MLKYYEIVLPLFRNDHYTAFTKEHAAFQKHVIAECGGITEGQRAYGSWTDEKGNVVKDDVIPYRFACGTEQANSILAKAFELFSDQKAIFIANIGSANILSREDFVNVNIAEVKRNAHE